MTSACGLCSNPMGIQVELSCYSRRRSVHHNSCDTVLFFSHKRQRTFGSSELVPFPLSHAAVRLPRLRKPATMQTLCNRVNDIRRRLIIINGVFAFRWLANISGFQGHFQFFFTVVLRTTSTTILQTLHAFGPTVCQVIRWLVRR